MSGTQARPGVKGRSDWETPPWLFEQLHAEFGFTVDAAAHGFNKKLPRWFGPGGERPCGLSASWEAERVWCNLPYGLETGKWVRKAAHERAGVAVLLVPANTETFWWHDYAMAVAHEIRFIRRRIHFLLGGRRVPNSRPVFSSAVLVFRDTERPCCVTTSIHAPDPRVLQDGRLPA